MSIFKKDLLFKLIQENEIKRGFTITGIPSQELMKNYLNRKDLIKFLESKNIKCNILDEFDTTDIGIYFPQIGAKTYADVCSINVSRIVDEEEYKNILDLFDEVLGYYQANIPCRIVNKIFNLYENEPLTFNDILLLIKDSQSEIARKINKSRQLIADVKSGKAKLTLENLSSLMKNYPLLPWEEWLRSYNA